MSEIQIGPKDHPRTEIGALGGLARWLGVGALVHAALLGPVFKTDSLWSWGYLVAWPLPLAWFVITTVAGFLWAVLVVLFWAALAGLLAWGLWELFQWLLIARRQSAERDERQAFERNQQAAARDGELG